MSVVLSNILIPNSSNVGRLRPVRDITDIGEANHINEAFPELETRGFREVYYMQYSA